MKERPMAKTVNALLRIDVAADSILVLIKTE